MSVASARAVAEQALADPRVVAFLQYVVRPPESGYGPGGYGLRWGDTSPSITDFSHHPGARNGYSAAGAYQFVIDTWNWLAPQVGVTDFSPHSQDLVAAQMLAVTGALPRLQANDIRGAIDAAHGINAWSSMPGGAYAKPDWTYEKAIAAYNGALGRPAGNPVAASGRTAPGSDPAGGPPASSLPIDTDTLLLLGGGLIGLIIVKRMLNDYI